MNGNNVFVINFGFETLKTRAKSALEAFHGAPIKKQHKVLNFLSDFLGYQDVNTMSALAHQPLEIKATIPLHTVTVIETDGVNDEIINTYTRKAASEESADALMLEVFESEMGDHDGIIEDFLSFAELEELDRSEIQEAVDNWDRTAIVEWASSYVGAETILGMLREITYGRVSASLESEFLEVELPLSSVEIVQQQEQNPDVLPAAEQSASKLTYNESIKSIADLYLDAAVYGARWEANGKVDMSEAENLMTASFNTEIPSSKYCPHIEADQDYARANKEWDSRVVRLFAKNVMRDLTASFPNEIRSLLTSLPVRATLRSGGISRWGEELSVKGSRNPTEVNLSDFFNQALLDGAGSDSELIAVIEQMEGFALKGAEQTEDILDWLDVGCPTLMEGFYSKEGGRPATVASGISALFNEEDLVTWIAVNAPEAFTELKW
ncbi:hypothetical protein [Neptuniibacter sp. QD37_11]|uniref:hypothetical protein n=1 Tax=Neptuniibacter sp. QD37_11 TaxID=3398209 RepID=UPI0039F61C1D